MNTSAKVDRRDSLKLAKTLTLASAGILAFSATQAAAAVDISHKIKIAGDLRMFTQRMALSAAFVMLDVEKDHYLEVLTEEYDEFTDDIDALRNGDPEFSMAPEENALVLEAINTVEFGWSVLGPPLKDVIDTGTVDDEHFSAIEHVNTQVMTLTDSLIHRILLEYKDAIPLDLAYQIDVVGSLRMLSQKMIKEAILVALEFEAEAHHEMLVGSMQLFRFDLDKLAGNMAHNEHTLPAATGEFAEHLTHAEHCWVKLQPILEKLDQTHAVEYAEVLELAHEADVILAALDAMNEILIKQADEA
ncbi:type IV pili methyl-accepting chemotaxis transducer N-terminal domain-containing protein [Octadecabacter sp. CECT 8868]|uniref:type IV pili methyl-accepting chemotaxis transducer N-terminal domain-containing protein n=1 Tax=Octadecabacter algicola TaxID=2909342 RepID=UPI001F313851|nr:type IV pili methyl-accepting chemotaxis transducer N-terminal domain-containing protein [Octadecabacter algicola]MCF2903985.1 type IV pili methyl-accepting chemotaxis transducer N-terminal domain-containing protein [Octadecabacter algicola]